MNTVSGKRDPLRGIESAKLIFASYRYLPLIEDDTDNDTDDEPNIKRHNDKTHNPNKRQRRKMKLQRVHEQSCDTRCAFVEGCDKTEQTIRHDISDADNIKVDAHVHGDMYKCANPNAE